MSKLDGFILFLQFVGTVTVMWVVISLFLAGVFWLFFRKGR